MTTIAILPENPGSPTSGYRAVAGKVQSVGQTAGQALDALTSQLGEADTGTLIVVQHLRPDRFFSAAQQQRLEELMARWRAARDAGTSLPPGEQAELDGLVEAEVRAASERARALIQGLAS
jgi:hypothetical protein